MDALSGSGERVPLSEMVWDSGFAPSTAVIHVERLGTEGLARVEVELLPLPALLLLGF